MKSHLYFKDGLIKGLRESLNIIDDSLSLYEDGAPERLALLSVRRHIDILRTVVRDTKSSFVHSEFVV